MEKEELDQKRSRSESQEEELPEQKVNKNGKKQKYVEKEQQHKDRASV